MVQPAAGGQQVGAGLGEREQGPVGEIGGQDSDDDRQLIKGHQPAAQVGRREFGDVHRRQHRRHPHPQTADNPSDDQHGVVRRNRRIQGGDKDKTAEITRIGLRPKRSLTRRPPPRRGCSRPGPNCRTSRRGICFVVLGLDKQTSRRLPPCQPNSKPPIEATRQMPARNHRLPEAGSDSCGLSHGGLDSIVMPRPSELEDFFESLPAIPLHTRQVERPFPHVAPSAAWTTSRRCR